MKFSRGDGRAGRDFRFEPARRGGPTFPLPMSNPKIPKFPRILTTTVGSYPIPDWLAALPS